MNESEWVQKIDDRIRSSCINDFDALSVRVGKKLSYGYEILEYEDKTDAPINNTNQYETDLIILESFPNGRWKPRLIIECKINSINTHDAITYSQKASSHKSVHPYLRYGIILGNRRDNPLPGRLYRHGTFFDFMMSFESFEPTESEMVRFNCVIREEIDASRQLERIIYDSRKKDRDKYTLLHRKLSLE